MRRARVMPTAEDFRVAVEVVRDALQRGVPVSQAFTEAGLDVAWYAKAVRTAQGALLREHMDQRRARAARSYMGGDA